MKQTLCALLASLSIGCSDTTTNNYYYNSGRDGGVESPKIADASNNKKENHNNKKSDSGDFDAGVSLDLSTDSQPNDGCLVPRGECLDTLGDYPNPFNRNTDETAVIYGEKCTDSVAVSDVVSGLPSCGVSTGSLILLDTEVKNYRSLDKNIISVGGTWCNRINAELLDVDYPTSREDLAGIAENTAVIEFRNLDNGRKALLVYGWDQDSTRRAAVLLRDYEVFRERLETAGLECAESITVGGVRFSVDGVNVGS